jgi:glycosyltransferase involved in cell wall biosynthesis
VNISIIICTRNRADSLDQTLESLHTIVVPEGLRPEVLVVDNGSTDHTSAIVRKHSHGSLMVRSILEPSPGQARARNTGLARSAGDIVIFTDDDVRFPKDWLSSMCDPIVANEGDAVAGNVRLAPHLEREWMRPVHRAWLASTERLDSKPPTDMVGANMAFSRSVLNVVSGFDPELGPGALGYADDTLFAWQLLKAGKTICHASGGTVTHHFDEERLSRASWIAAAARSGRSYAYLTHHWLHEVVSGVFYRDLADYCLHRVREWRQCLHREGIPAWELKRLKALHCLAHYQVERKRPNNYEPQGLVKLTHVTK